MLYMIYSESFPVEGFLLQVKAPHHTTPEDPKIHSTFLSQEMQRIHRKKA
jgi:hypothetical protein